MLDLAAVVFRVELGFLLLSGTLVGMCAIPLYIFTHLRKLASLRPGTEGWNTT